MNVFATWSQSNKRLSHIGPAPCTTMSVTRSSLGCGSRELYTFTGNVVTWNLVAVIHIYRYYL